MEQEVWNRYARRGARLALEMLVPRPLRGLCRMCGPTEGIVDRGCEDGGVVVHAESSRYRVPGVKRVRAVDGALAVGEVEGEQGVGPGSLERRGPLRRDGQINVEAAGRFDERRRAIGGGREKKEESRTSQTYFLAA